MNLPQIAEFLSDRARVVSARPALKSLALELLAVSTEVARSEDKLALHDPGCSCGLSQMMLCRVGDLNLAGEGLARVVHSLLDSPDLAGAEVGREVLTIRRKCNDLAGRIGDDSRKRSRRSGLRPSVWLRIRRMQKLGRSIVRSVGF